MILSQCPLLECIDVKVLKEYVQKDVISNKEYYDDLKMNYKINDPKKAEWIIGKTIKKCKLVGNGSKCIDINVCDTIGIDVSVLTLSNNKNTNEKKYYAKLF